jgi:SAM-dependent methyltransferase
MNQTEIDRPMITAQVRDFYDRHPYPPPVTGLDGYRQKWQDEERRRADYHLFWPAKPYREELDILVAGCGTSQAARYALRFPTARIMGIDVSATSIQETEKLKQKYVLDNLELTQLPIECADKLEQQFDQIICTGVLHHLPDPAMGLRALREILKPDGVMHLMVYAAYGRTGIYMIQDYCRRLGIANSEEEITELAETLLAMPQSHPLARLLGEAPDFRRKAALADALLNPQDRAYTVPQFFEFIQSGGLNFERWLRQAPYLPHCGDLANTPHAARLTNLPTKEQHTAVELFRGTMLRHSAVIYRDDNRDLFGSIQFANEAWLAYIPHRLPGTIVVEERLPPGAAAVLINQNHTYTDIYLPVSHEEKQIVEGINGRRSVADLISSRTSKKQDRWRSFFKKLWWYDQITFHTSGE